MSDHQQPTSQAWTAALEFWGALWQMQIESSLAFWSVWAQGLPRKSAQQLSAEAEALKARPAAAPAPAAPPPTRTTHRAKPSPRHA